MERVVDAGHVRMARCWHPAILGAYSRRPSGPGAPQPIVISYGFWQRRFGADPDILDRQVRIQDG
jgi:hypothetical protein